MKEDPQTVTLGPVLDSVSQINGNQDGLTFCGQRVYTLIDPTNTFLTVDSSSGDGALTIKPIAEEDEGLYDVGV